MVGLPTKQVGEVQLGNGAEDDHAFRLSRAFVVDSCVSPESEIYGRSLGTIRRLGAFMINKSPGEVIRSPEADQARAEFYTSVEEGFGTDVELGGGLEVRDFDARPIINGRVMSKDLKTAISDMTEAGLRCAEETARKDSRFLPQLTRSLWDHKNALAVDSMARGETDYNTRIVISPFPEEAARETGDSYWRHIGYVPNSRRGFVQLYHTTGGQLLTGSLSFDGSNKQRLREIFGSLNIEIPEGEITDNWLKYALTTTLSSEQAKALAIEIANKAGGPTQRKTTNTIEVTRKHRPIMDRVFDESYIYICESLARHHQTEGATQLIHQLADKAHHFNKRYATALYKMRADKYRFTDDDSIILHELLVYSTIEIMRALHLKETLGLDSTGNTVRLFSDYIQSADPSSLQNILSNFGVEGALNGRVYSACGLSISLGDDNMSGENPQGIFGGIDNLRNMMSNEDKYGSLTFKCPKGHTNTRPRNKLIEKCKTCGTSVRC